MVSLWEIAIKAQLGAPTSGSTRGYCGAVRSTTATKNSLLQANHAVAIAQLPPLHKDPFDRLLIVQGIVEGITLITANPIVARYPAPVRRV
ncbi:MAG TPA: type II toxin-antitoxin system VapC family toxin [Stellaceae bacterium]